MKCFRILTILALLTQAILVSAAPGTTFSPDNLPAPSWVNAVEITSSKIHIVWESVSGADHYRVRRHDDTHNIQLPDVFPVEAEYTSQPHDPGTTISFEIIPVDAAGVEGSPANAEFTTTIIIVDNIVNFSIQTPLSPDITLPSNGEVALGFDNPDKYTSNITVQHYKVKSGNSYAEFLLWSQCSTPESNSARIQYYSQSSDISIEEIHIFPDGPITAIRFKISGNSFCSLIYPGFNATNGILGSGQLTLHNERKLLPITWNKANDPNQNPCYQPHFDGGDGDNTPTEATSDDVSLEDRSITPVNNSQALLVNPNPFSDGFTAQYTLDTPGAVILTLRDRMGRELRTMNLGSLESGAYATNIYTNDLPAGMYMLSLQTNEGRKTTTLVKN